MRKLITEKDVILAHKNGQKQIGIPPQTLVTPAARDAAKARQIVFVAAVQSAQVPNSPQIAVAQGPIGQGPIAIGADHGGFALKGVIVRHLQSLGFVVHDLGTHSSDPVDYPDVAHAVAQEVAGGAARWGIIVDGAGIGSAIVANKVPGIRAACCNDVFTAENSREHNGANILTLGGRVIGEALALKIVTSWLQTNFGGGRHQHRLNKVIAIDEQYRKRD